MLNPQCEETVEEAKHYKWRIDRQTGKRTQIPRKGHDHCWDATRYAVMGRDAAGSGGVEMLRVEGF